MRVLFCNVAWMKYYDGISEDDKPINGGKFIYENEDGAKLSAEEVSVKEVALMTGYDSLNNFYKNFKNATGKTPAIYLSEKNK